MLNNTTFRVSTPGDTEIVVEREFSAHCSFVFDAMSKPVLLKQWLKGPPGWEMTTCEDEGKVGGKYRWVWRGPDGAEMAMSGVYREITPPTRIVRTETFEIGCAPQASEQVGTLELKQVGPKTSMTLTLVYPSKEARDAAIASGMEHGMAAGYNRLDELISSVAKW